VITVVGTYAVEQRHDGVVVGLGEVHTPAFGTLCAIVLAACWWFGPYGPGDLTALASAPESANRLYWIWTDGYWLWTGLAGLGTAIGFLAPHHHRDIWIFETHIVFASIFIGWKKLTRVPRGATLKLVTEEVVAGDLMLPLRIRLLDAEGEPAGFPLEFRSQANVDQLVELLRSRWDVDVSHKKVG
jgi:hypothetical protein